MALYPANLTQSMSYSNPDLNNQVQVHTHVSYTRRRTRSAVTNRSPVTRVYKARSPSRIRSKIQNNPYRRYKLGSTGNSGDWKPYMSQPILHGIGRNLDSFDDFHWSYFLAYEGEDGESGSGTPSPQQSRTRKSPVPLAPLRLNLPSSPVPTLPPQPTPSKVMPEVHAKGERYHLKIPPHSAESVMGGEGSGVGKKYKISMAPAYDTLLHPLRQCRPSSTTSTQPPPYPSSSLKIQPPDDEGSERLPAYTNDVFLRAIMPRKMEFSAPGLQPKDRKWRRVLCVLEGTAFRVYKAPAGTSWVASLREWWEIKDGQGCGESHLDVGPSLSRPRSPRASLNDPSSGRTTPTSAGSMRSDSPAPTFSSVLSHPRSSGPVTWVSDSQSQLQSQPMPGHSISSARSVFRVGAGSMVNSDSGARPSRSSSLSSHGEWRADHASEPDEADLIRAYTMQHAVSGLGSDQVRRKHIIRVRLEGEQFLLQAQDVDSVIVWVEGLQSATNIALDLDERSMPPESPIIPRRRRRVPQPRPEAF